MAVNVERLSQDFLRVCEAAAVACARTMGQGDRRHSDHVATESMRKEMDAIAMRGTVVIGEGERDEAPMLFIGEKVGRGRADDMEVDIAVDPLEGTNLCATGANNAITVLAASNKGGLLHAPDCYMEKIIVGPSAKRAIDIDAPVETSGTDGSFMHGVRFFGGGYRTSSVSMSLRERLIRFADTVRLEDGSDVVVEF